MTIFVYITEECRQQAHTYHLTADLNKLASDIEREQAFWRLDAFPYPFWVKKRLGNRHSRLVCRLESHQIHGQTHDVLVCLCIFQRGDKHYHEVYWQMTEKGEAIYQRLVSPPVLKIWLEQRCAHPEPLGLPLPNTEERNFLYFARSGFAHVEQDTLQPMMYESWSWVERGLRVCSPNDLSLIAQALAEWDSATDSHAIAQIAHYQVWLLAFPKSQACLLTIEPLEGNDDIDPTQLSERHINKQMLEQASHTMSLAAFQDFLARAARRMYPQTLLAQPESWLAIQYNHTTNLAFSPEESEILHFSQHAARPFPLFINGRAGSGKSTILQYLFADYIHYAFEQASLNTQALYPVYFTCNATLTERAIDTIRHIVHHPELSAANITLTLKRYCLEFRSFLIHLLPLSQQAMFARDKWLDYGRFRRLWEHKFGQQAEAVRKYPASLCWHVIRSYIKGLNDDSFLEPDEYQELGAEQRLLDNAVFQDIYDKVWVKWYQPLCKQHGYWDDQDIARHILTHDLAQPTFPAIFCDEAQDFTRIEVQIILRLNLFSARQLSPRDIQRIPLVFAGDQFQTLNPTGFRWESIKAQVVEQFIFALDPAKHAALSDINYRELSYNFRSTQTIAQFSNIIHGLRAKLFQLKDLKPQQSWYEHNSGRDIVFVDTQDRTLSVQLAQQYDLVFVLPCLDGQETTFIANNPLLRQYLQLRADGSTSIPAMSVIRAKGLEFERVVLYGFAADCPADLNLSASSPTTPTHIHHEYFLNRLYVAVTRARSQVLIIDPPSGYTAFWQHFQQPWQPPLQLANLPQAHDMWEKHLGTLRLATLADITPDANQIRLMAENAQQLFKEGLDAQDVYLLRQAAGLYEQLGDLRQQQYCLAEVLFIEESYLDAGLIFNSIHHYERAFHSFWRSQQWDKLLELSQRKVLPHALQHAPEADAVTLLVKAGGLASYVDLLRVLCQPETILSPHLHDQQAWYILLGQILETLPLDKIDKKWPRLYSLLKQLSEHTYFHTAIHPMVLAEVAYMAQSMADACVWWEKSKELYKITPPFPRYAEALAASRAFPDNLDALVSLQRHDDICQQFSNYSTLNELHPRAFQLVLDALFSTLSPQKAAELFNQKLLTLRQLPLLDLLITQLEQHSPNASNAWLKRLHKLRVFRACTEGDWDFVSSKLSTEADEAEKPAQTPSATLELILHGLSHSEPYSQMTEEDHASKDAQNIMDMLRKLFQAHVIKQKRDKRGLTSSEATLVWRTDPKSSHLLGAVLERSQNFVEALQFYETLEHVKGEKAYAQQRWLACKLRQTDHAHKLIEFYRDKLNVATRSHEREDYERKLRDTEHRAESYQNTARRQKRLLNLDDYADIPAYPELLTIERIIKGILHIKDSPVSPLVEPTLPTPEAASVVEAIPAEVKPAEVTVETNVETETDTETKTEVETKAGAEIEIKVEIVKIPKAASHRSKNTKVPFQKVPLSTAITDSGGSAPITTVCLPTQLIMPVLASAPHDKALSESIAIIPPSLTQDNSSVEQDTPVCSEPRDVAVSQAPDNTPESLPPLVDTVVSAPIVSAVLAEMPVGQEEVSTLLPHPTALSVTSPPTYATLESRSSEDSAPPAHVTRLPTTTLHLFDYRLLIVRTQGRLNIEHQLTGESVSIWPKNQRLQGDWLLSTSAQNGLFPLQGTCLWLQFVPNSHDCIIAIPEHGIQLQLNCG